MNVAKIELKIKDYNVREVRERVYQLGLKF